MFWQEGGTESCHSNCRVTVFTQQCMCVIGLRGGELCCAPPSLADHPRSRRGDGWRGDSDRACWLRLMRCTLTAPPRAGVCGTSLLGNSRGSREGLSVCNKFTCSMRDGHLTEVFWEQRAEQHVVTPRILFIIHFHRFLDLVPKYTFLILFSFSFVFVIKSLTFILSIHKGERQRVSYILRKFTFLWQACSEQLLLAIGENVKGASISIFQPIATEKHCGSTMSGTAGWFFRFFRPNIASISACVKLFLGRKIVCHSDGRAFSTLEKVHFQWKFD